MRRGIVAAVPFAILALFVASASAAPARPTIQDTAEEIHSESFTGGGAELSNCHRGAQRRTVVCSVELSGIVQSPEGDAEGRCTTAIAAIWERVQVTGLSKGDITGIWNPRMVADFECEGTLL